MTTFIPRQPDEYSDVLFEAAEAARAYAARPPDVTETLARIERKIDEFNASVAYVVTVADQVKEQATPTLDAIMANPMFKILAGKVKK